MDDLADFYNVRPSLIVNNTMNHRSVLSSSRSRHTRYWRDWSSDVCSSDLFVITTDSRHNLPVYPNLAGAITPDRVNQVWRADITYIRLRTEFISLAAVLDAFSRRVIGWALGRTLEAELAVSALTMALRQRRPEPGLVHHSDRGVQYASREYTDLLKQHGAQISMSRKGNPYDNAACESFMKTLKYEEVYRSEYRDLADAYAQIGVFLERVYNQRRLHSALGYVPPAEFEQNGGSIQ